jgi:putative Mg2+ transporter-C (MgtC) family protein
MPGVVIPVHTGKKTMNDLQLFGPEIGKLLLAAFLGGIIGFEREAHGQAAGIRTNLLISLGACLMMLLSLHMEEIFRHLDVDSTVRLDPGRIASYAIASMGFLGAGAIIKGRGSVRGLTTAAGLWLVTGIGLAVGAGLFVPALATTLLSIFVLYFIRRAKVFVSRDIFTILSLRFSYRSGVLDQVRKIFLLYPNIVIQFINIQQNIAAEALTYRLRLQSKEQIQREEIMQKILDMEGIEEISWEEGNVP